MRRMRPVRASPPWFMSDQQARSSSRSRGCRLLDRSVVNDLWDLMSEPNPLPEIKASVATALTPYIDRPGATAIADCLLPANWPRHWNWSNFRPTATRFEDEVMVGNATPFGWTSHATSLHEALDEEAGSNNSFRHFHALCRDRRRSVSVLAPLLVLARPLRSVQTQAPPPADRL
jgi:hypothetical protein